MTPSPLFDLESLNSSLNAHGIPGASIARVHQGETRQLAAGITNVITQVDVDEATVFQIGSISKIFTATLVYKLAEEGLIELDQPVSTYLPDLEIGHAPPPDTLTVRSLLDYTSGIDGEYFEDFGTGDDALERYVAACADLRFTHQPNELRSYNSTAYCIAGRIIEVLTESSFNQAMREHLLLPLGLNQVTFYDHETLRYKAAIGHNTINGKATPTDLIMLPACMSPAGAALTMTAEDLLAFGQLHLHHGQLPNGDRYLSEASVNDMQTVRTILPPGQQDIIVGWATLPTTHGRLIVGSGQAAGQNSFLIFLPELEYACAVLANSDDGAANLMLTLGFEDLKLCTGAVVDVPEPPTPPANTPTDLTLYEGVFANPHAA